MPNFVSIFNSHNKRIINNNISKPSTPIREKKHANTETNLVWNVLDKARAYKPETKRCVLCLTEKYHIIFSNLNLLNSRNELVT